jgi:hypothetical protein
MRIIEFLQKLNAKSLRLASKRQSGMVVFVLSTPTAQQLKDAREHLRYWPYVKAFRPVDETHMKVLVFVGRGIPETKWNHYVTRSCELMNQCVRQYQALFVTTNECPAFGLRQYHRNGFLRPDDLLKPFCDFIDEIYQEPSSINNNNLNH